MSNNNNKPNRESQGKKDFIHPYTFTIVAFGLEEPISKLRQNDYTGFLRSLTDFCLILDPDIKEVLAEEIADLRSMRYGEESLDEDKLIQISEKIYNALHDEGYFATAKNGPATRTTGIEALETKMKEREERMAKRLEAGPDSS